MVLGSTQPLTEMSTRSISWGKGGRCVRLTTLPPSCAVVTKSGNLNCLEPSGPLQACNRTAFHIKISSHTVRGSRYTSRLNRQNHECNRYSLALRPSYDPRTALISQRHIHPVCGTGSSGFLFDIGESFLKSVSSIYTEIR